MGEVCLLVWEKGRRKGVGNWELIGGFKGFWVVGWGKGGLGSGYEGCVTPGGRRGRKRKYK